MNYNFSINLAYLEFEKNNIGPKNSEKVMIHLVFYQKRAKFDFFLEPIAVLISI